MSLLRRLFRRPGLLIVTLAALLAGVIELVDDDGLRRLYRLQESIVATELENAKLRGDVERMRHRVAALKSDPAALERAAREHGYVREGELLFRLE